MINVLFNDFKYEVLPKKLETWDKYCKIIQWGRQNPTRFLEDFMNLQFTDHQKWILLSSWIPRNVVWVCSRSSGKSFMSAPFIMAKSLLFPSHKTYIMAPSGGQSMETFTKLENLAKNNIASVIGVSSVYLDNCVKQNIGTDAFTHNKSGYNVTLYNGSEVNSLNSVVNNIVGLRSSLNIYDEAGKIPRDFFALTLPFTVQNTDFLTGSGINQDIYPRQLQNQNMLMSSAEGIDSELFDRYKLAFEKMLLGDPDYFVADIDCSLSLHPFINGKPSAPLVSQQTIDDAFATNPFRATREYLNKFDSNAGEDAYIKRSTLTKYEKPEFPTFQNDGTKKYIITMDMAAKLDNCIIMVGELYRDEERGLMCKIVNCQNLIEVLANGEKVIKQRPEQLEILKQTILDYNKGYDEYNGISRLIIDAAGGGFEGMSFLLDEWKGKDGKLHRGFLDDNDPYQSLRRDDYPGAADNITLFNFKRDKVEAYERTQSALNQGLLWLPQSLNARGELEFQEIRPDGEVIVRYEKPSADELNALIQIDLAKEEISSFQKIKKPNGTIQFDLSPEAKSRSAHDDRADCLALMGYWLMELRTREALDKEAPVNNFSSIFSMTKHSNNNQKKKINPFVGGKNPFSRR